MGGQARGEEPDEFHERIAPLLERRCVSCHNDQQRKGDFSLETAERAFADGYIEPGDAGASHLIDVLTPVGGRARMPKDADPLSADDLAALRAWIDRGARWPAEVRLSEPRVADLNWWSLRPLQRPAVPVPERDARPATGGDARRQLPQRNPIDAFVQRKLDEQGLSCASEADRRTLIRRVSFDLLGLPPSPEEVEEFVQDEDPRAYERLVDRLLASPHYGEHWARHWLDVVHYADTHGYDKDKPRPNAWPYRDYVIRSLNQDKPYAQFVREQIAGDVLWPGTVDGVTATGFIAAGPWDFIGHAEVPETKIDGRIARHLDRDDMVSSTLNTFCSITVQCARCHSHKFDPVTQEHYYSLQAVFAALDRAERSYDADPHTAARREQLAERQRQLAAEHAELDSEVARAAGPQLAAVDADLSKLRGQQQAATGARPEFGYHSAIEASPDATKWVQVDLGQTTAIATVVYVGCHDNFNGIGHGFGFPVRYKIELSDDPLFQRAVTTLVDHTRADVDNPGTSPQSIQAPAGTEARYVRVTATRLAPRQNDYIFALAELSVLTPDGRNAARGQPVTALDSIEAPVRWRRQNLVDEYFYGAGQPGRERIAELTRQRRELLAASLSDELRARLAATGEALRQTAEALQALPPQRSVYAGTVHTGAGNFVGTGAASGRPRAIHVLHRGNILEPRGEVAPGALPIIPGLDWRFNLPSEHAEGERRVALADWLVHADNPLTWRSIVNRVWLYHFGRGIVDSPNDLGRMGQLPTHPELLDWLAVEFRDGGQSLKTLHKLIVTSSVYRQSSADDPRQSQLDRDNAWLWRMNRRRLTAEEVRDAVLAVSGKLDRSMYGPGYQLFVVERPEHSPHYEYDLHDPDDARSHRRGIYRFIVRSQPDPFMTALDCADSSQSVPKRDETVTALQALSLLNNKFMLRMSEHFAARLRSEADGDDAQVERGFGLVTGRRPAEAERAALADYARQHGTENLCRLLLNLNEFVFVD
ncbi:MAG: DUF1553 domain-containing protein [Pirellulaceae bacterium]|nr:DUF1553 domain-containing protein [Pirellulaceae bacterium]